jgi:hypothetical protein
VTGVVVGVGGWSLDGFTVGDNRGGNAEDSTGLISATGGGRSLYNDGACLEVAGAEIAFAEESEVATATTSVVTLSSVAECETGIGSSA